MDAFDWEERDQDTPFYIHMVGTPPLTQPAPSQASASICP